MHDLAAEIEKLSAAQQREVIDFIALLRARGSERRKKRATLEWAGALEELGNQYSSVQLQHVASDLRNPRV